MMLFFDLICGRFGIILDTVLEGCWSKNVSLQQTRRFIKILENNDFPQDN